MELEDVSNIVSGMPLRLEHWNNETDHNVREFGSKKIRQTPISDNRVDSTQKSNTDINICFQLKNQRNKFSLKVLFLKVKSVTRLELECHLNAE